MDPAGRTSLASRPRRLAFAAVLGAALALLPRGLPAHPPEAAAIDALTAALRMTPSDVDMRSRRAELRMAAGDLAGAEDDYAFVLRVVPAHRDAALGRVEVARRSSRPDEAFRRADAFVVLHPLDPAGWRARGRTLRDLGFPGAAARSLDRSLALEPHPAPEDFLERAELARAEGRPAVAAAVLSLGIRRLGDVPSLRWKLAGIAAAHGRLALALAQVERTLPRGGHPAHVALRRGELLASAGRVLDACAEWTVALEELEGSPAAPTPEARRLRGLLRARLAGTGDS